MTAHSPIRSPRADAVAALCLALGERHEISRFARLLLPYDSLSAGLHRDAPAELRDMADNLRALAEELADDMEQAADHLEDER